MSEMLDPSVLIRKGPWQQKITFVAAFEIQYQNGELTVQELASKIFSRFQKDRWIWDDSDNKFIDFQTKPGLCYAAHESLCEICDRLHTIAYAKDIFDDPSEYPDVDAYDNWKTSLYDWADENRVWIEPAF